MAQVLRFSVEEQGFRVRVNMQDPYINHNTRAVQAMKHHMTQCVGSNNFTIVIVTKAVAPMETVKTALVAVIFELLQKYNTYVLQKSSIPEADDDGEDDAVGVGHIVNNLFPNCEEVELNALFIGNQSVNDFEAHGNIMYNVEDVAQSYRELIANHQGERF